MQLHAFVLCYDRHVPRLATVEGIAPQIAHHIPGMRNKAWRGLLLPGLESEPVVGVGAVPWRKNVIDKVFRAMLEYRVRAQEPARIPRLACLARSRRYHSYDIINNIGLLRLRFSSRREGKNLPDIHK